MTDLFTPPVTEDDLLSSREVIPQASKPEVTPGIFDGVREKLAEKKAAAPKKAPAAKKRIGTKAAAKERVPRDPTKPAAPKAPPRRALGESLARVILQVGRVVNAIEPPTGAAIMFEAGALGAAVDKAIAGTRVDKIAQRGAGVAERFEPLVPLVSLPAMVFILSHNQELAPMLEGELREAIEDVLLQSLPLLKKRAQRTSDTLEALTQLKAIDPSFGASEDPIGDILNSFFPQQNNTTQGDGEPNN